jgi:DDE superfamily endonuclease
MPRVSDRKRVLLAIENDLERRKVTTKALRVLANADAMSDLIDDDDDADYNNDNTMLEVYECNQLNVETLEYTYNEIKNKRYLMERKPYCTGLNNVFVRDLKDQDNEDGSPPWLQEEEFLQKYRMHRESFRQLLDMIKDNPVFQSSGVREQAPVAHQLLLFLFYLGKSGSGANNPTLRNMFQVGRGTPDCYKRQCIKAIRCLRDSVISWPDAKERKDIAKRMLHQYDWINCVRVVDGTLFPLTYEPRSEDAPDYNGRKFQYSLSTIIVNDDNKRIRHYLAGFPGTAHDNRIYQNRKLYQQPELYFGKNQCIVGDCAFENTNHMVTSYKKLYKQTLPNDNEGFNTYMGKIQITSEHTIGMLKGRFQFLRLIPMIIDNSPNSIRHILRVIDCCIILHNLLVDVGDNIIPEEWCDDNDVINDDVGVYIGEHDFGANIETNQPNVSRREICFTYYKNFYR